MKIALYIEDGLEQVVLTPESKFDEAILGKLDSGAHDLKIARGDFFHCQGGYVHQGVPTNSILLVLTPSKPKPPDGLASSPLDIEGYKVLLDKIEEVHSALSECLPYDHGGQAIPRLSVAEERLRDLRNALSI